MGRRRVGRRRWRGGEAEGVDQKGMDAGDECHWAALMLTRWVQSFLRFDATFYLVFQCGT